MNPASIKSERDLIALAIALEQRAARRFKTLSLRMAALGRPDLSGLFEGLAREEEDHAKALLSLPSAAGLEAEATDRVAATYLPGDVDPEREDPPSRDSVYACLAKAVKNEQKAFEYFSFIAASTEDEGIQNLAEDLAREELGHARLLRGLRRQAYHRQKSKDPLWPKPSEILSLSDLTRAAFEGEAALAAELQRLSNDFAELESITASTEELLSSLAPNRPPPAGSGLDHGSLRERLQAAFDQAQDAFVFYDAVVGAASTEEIMLAAQSLSDHALKRIQVLRSEIGPVLEPLLPS